MRWAWLLLMLLSATAAAKQQVKVGVYEFLPYAFVGEKVTGVTAEMIELMNGVQQKYEFVVVPTTAERRYKDFAEKRFDMLIFESKSWGWNKSPVAVSRAFLLGAEVYVALQQPGRDQRFFSDFKNKGMIGVLGFHYGFARFHAERDYLEKNFDIVLTQSQPKSLEALFKRRGEIAVLSRDYLNYYLKKHPKQQEQLLISDKLDQTYRHTILLRNGLKDISIRDINQLLMTMRRNETLEPLWQKYGLGNKE